jgi:hypothetical protein
MQYAVVGDTAINKDRSQVAGRLQARFSMGYNGTTFYGGLSGVSDNFDYNNATLSYIKHNFGVVRVFVGYRFPARKKES